MAVSKTTDITEEKNPFIGRKYSRAVGRRKSASATAQLYTKGSGMFVVNKKPLEQYCKHQYLIAVMQSPLELVGKKAAFDINARVQGGGFKSQAEAIRLAIARALVNHDEDTKPVLRKAGFVTVDSRVKERKKPGLKRARRAPQWSKR